MRFTAQIDYPAPPAAVAAMLADPEFVDRRCAATGAVSYESSVEGDASGPFTVTSVRTMPTDTFPDIARRFVGDTVEVRQTDTWAAPAADGTRTGTLDVDMVGMPMRLTGSLRLDADGQGCVEHIDGDLKASVPLIGGKLEKAAEPAMQMAVRKEGEVGREWLA